MSCAAQSVGMTPIALTSPIAAIVGDIFLIAFLVGLLLAGGFVVLSLGMASKRPEDHIGRHDPSEDGIYASVLDLTAVPMVSAEAAAQARAEQAAAQGQDQADARERKAS